MFHSHPSSEMVFRVFLIVFWGKTSYDLNAIFVEISDDGNFLPLILCFRTCSYSLCKSGRITFSWVPQRSTEISNSYC